MGRILGPISNAQTADSALEDATCRASQSSVKVLVDTDVCIAIINRDPRVRAHLERHAPSALRVSAVTLGELRFGIAKSTQPRRATTNLNLLMAKVGVVAYDEKAAGRYGELRALLESRGVPIGPLDTLIAAHALSQRWTLATHNIREFRRVPGLAVVDWLA